MRLQIPLVHKLKLYLHQLYDANHSDERLASYLADIFESDDLQGTQIDGLRFYVKDRIVTIHGTLYSEYDHEMVIKYASRIAGLKAVVDQMKVIKDVNKEDPSARIFLLLNDRLETKRLIPA